MKKKLLSYFLSLIIVAFLISGIYFAFFHPDGWFSSIGSWFSLFWNSQENDDTESLADYWNDCDTVIKVDPKQHSSMKSTINVVAFYNNFYGKLIIECLEAAGYNALSEEYLLCSLYDLWPTDNILQEAMQNNQHIRRVTILDSDRYHWKESYGDPNAAYTIQEIYRFNVHYPELNRFYDFMVCLTETHDSGKELETYLIERGYYPSTSGISEEYSIGTMYVTDCDLSGIPLLAEPYSHLPAQKYVPYGAAVNCYLYDDVYLLCVYQDSEGYLPRSNLSFSKPDTVGIASAVSEPQYSEPARQPASADIGSIATQTYPQPNSPQVNSELGSVEQPLADSDFYDRYPNYIPFDGENFASSRYTAELSMGMYLFSAGSREYRVVNCENFVSLRTEASRKSPRISEVPLGAAVYCNGILDDWALCTYNGRYGWISSGYLTPAGDYDNYYENNCDDDTEWDEQAVSASDYRASLEVMDFGYAWEPVIYRYYVDGPGLPNASLSYSVSCRYNGGICSEEVFLGNWIGDSTNGSFLVEFPDIPSDAGEAVFECAMYIDVNNTTSCIGYIEISSAV